MKTWEVVELIIHIVFSLLYITDAAATLVSQTLYKSEGSENDAIEVGPGNLKLIYSGIEGKLSQYVNNRSSVCHCHLCYINHLFFNMLIILYYVSFEREYNLFKSNLVLVQIWRSKPL